MLVLYTTVFAFLFYLIHLFFLSLSFLLPFLLCLLLILNTSSSGNASKDKVLTGKKNLPAATLNLCEYSRLRSELKKQTDIVEKQYQG